METLVKRNSLFPVVNTLPVMNTLLDDFFSKDIFDWTDRNFTALGSNLPSVNLKETENQLEVELAAPGLKKEDFKVEIENNTLLISSEKQEEISYQSFYRSFYLPEYVDESKIEANYKDGILHVTIAKKEGSKKKTAKTIAIK